MIALLIFCATLLLYTLQRNGKKSTQTIFFQFAPPVDTGQVCVHPDLSKDSRILDEFYTPLPPIKCREHDWVYTRDGRLYLNKTVLEILKLDEDSIRCTYAALRRESDFRTSCSDEKPFYVSGEVIPTDFFRVTCKAHSAYTNLFNIFSPVPSYLNYHAHVRYEDEMVAKLETPTSDPKLGLDVVMIGLDSVSQIAWRRLLPRTYNYMVKTLGSVLMESYNIVGDGTPQALIPILTGYNELELPDCLWRTKGSSTVDVYPMIWKEFKKAGYMTLLAEDAPGIGTFQYRMRGFETQPTDHYMRTFYLHATPQFSKERDLCLGAIPRHKVPLNYLQDFITVYRKQRKFAFLFYNELSHDDPNGLQHADDDLSQLLQNLQERKLLNNTMLIMFSDHGSRFSKFRATSQGLLEERMPFVSVTLPLWFRERFPKEWQNLRVNSKRLVTPYDLHALIREAIDFKGADQTYSLQSRSISPFAEIPKERACADAGIDTHWCACLAWEPVHVNDVNIKAIAEDLITYINEFISTEEDKCAKLKLAEIVRASKLKPNQKMLSFSKSKDINGRIPEFNNKADIVRVDYQLTISTKPGNGLFEATMTIVEGQIERVNDDSISRVNKYGNDPHCILQTRDDLRKYCFCKDLLQ